MQDVRSFDEQEIILETELGVLLIRGSGLHIGRLTLEKGEIVFAVSATLSTSTFTALPPKPISIISPRRN